MDTEKQTKVAVEERKTNKVAVWGQGNRHGWPVRDMKTALGGCEGTGEKPCVALWKQENIHGLPCWDRTGCVETGKPIWVGKQTWMAMRGQENRHR